MERDQPDDEVFVWVFVEVRLQELKVLQGLMGVCAQSQLSEKV